MSIQRNTVQRQIVLNALIKLNTHSSVEEIYDEVNKEHPSISKSTVYRNLRQLAKNGLIKQIILPDGLERYDRNANRHYHFNCKSCGSVYDVDIDHVMDIDHIVQAKYGFQVDGHDVVFSGICQNCRQE